MEREPLNPSPPLTEWPPAEVRPSELTPRRLALHLILLLLTMVTTFVMGAVMSPDFRTWRQIIDDPRVISSGLAYSFTLIAILLAHEMGHYLACRHYRIRATLPYFIPAPTLIGTFGAFIRIKEPITSRRALFDIGIAGPLAGFAVALPASLIGLLIAEPAPPVPPHTRSIIFQDPLLFILIQRLFEVPHMTEWNPIYFAAWVGMLATSLNLLPVGQLDGGHVVYALLGRRGHRAVAVGIFVLVCVLAVIAYNRYHWPGWFLYVGLLGLLLVLRHPPLADEHQPLDQPRRLVGVVGLIVFVLSFLPFPIIVS
ncbi:MAG: site-2 protease family protein [Acidobacteria bacterium]|nr:MAG: site-2 protease family protein [Acidobacteriota bacterium]